MAGGDEFSGWDWAVFVVTVVASLSTGVFAGWVARRKARKGNAKSTAAEFLMGGRDLNPFAVALSTMFGAMSAVTVLGQPAEMYAYGTQMWMNLFGFALGFVFVHLVNLKVFYPLKITSMFTYIEMRFHSTALRAFSIYSYLLGGFLYMGLCIYTPSLAMETVTGLPPWVSITIMGVICTIYSSWGGVRAVVYTEILQVFVMMAGVLVIAITATVEVGGIGHVWDIAWEHDRVEFLNTDPNPLQRHSLWLVTVQGYFFSVLAFGMGQAQVQRICSVSTWGKAIGAHYLNLCILITAFCCVNFMGIAVFAVYATCDPLATGKIEKVDQIVPFYVIDRLSGLCGVPGLFVAALYAGALSSFSSQINAVAAITWEDFFKNSAWVESMREERRPYVNVIVSVIAGMAGVVSGLLATQVGGVFQAAQTIAGTLSAPLLGLFLLGMCCPFANKIGGAVGLAVSLTFSFWVTSGAMIYASPAPTLDFSDEGCNTSTSFPPSFSSTSSSSTEFPPSSSSSFSYLASFSPLSSSLSSTESVFSSIFSSSFPPFSSTTEHPEDPYVFPLYLISYTLYSFIGVSNTVFVGAVTSLLFKPWTTEKTCKIYLHPTFYALQKRWERRRSPQDLPSISTQNLVTLEKY